MTFPNEITGTFTQNILLGTGFLKVYKEGILFLTFTESDISIVGNSFSIDVSNLFPDNGNYYILFSNGLFKSSYEIYAGITDITKWTFTIADGEYSNTEYSNEFLIN